MSSKDRFPCSGSMLFRVLMRLSQMMNFHRRLEDQAANWLRRPHERGETASTFTRRFVMTALGTKRDPSSQGISYSSQRRQGTNY
jgi:hypothetical protein